MSGSGRTAAAPTGSAKLPIECKDLTAKRNEYLFGLPSAFTPFLRSIMHNELDLPVAYLMFNILAMMLPSAIVQFMLPVDMFRTRLALGFFHLFLLMVFLQRFVLMLHVTSHRPAFKGPTALGAGILNSLNSYVIAPLFGIQPGVYYAHHVVMHHVENNVFPYDVSSTEPYQRDSILHFLHYWARFLIACGLELPYYAYTKGRYAMCAKAILTQSLFWIMNVSLYRINPMATLFVFLIPLLIASFALMFGNWSQHVFIDPDRPTSNFALAYNCMNHWENQTTFNDGFHINHHINSRLHWSQMPLDFTKKLDKYAANDAFLFNDIHFMGVGLYVMSGRLDKLADHFVQYGQKPRSKAEIVAEFKRRLTPIHHRSA